MSAPAADDEVGAPAVSSDRGGDAMMAAPSKHERGGTKGRRGGKDREAAAADSDKEAEGDSDSSSGDGSSDGGEVSFVFLEAGLCVFFVRPGLLCCGLRREQ